jgi:hypothetical protein
LKLLTMRGTPSVIFLLALHAAAMAQPATDCAAKSVVLLHCLEAEKARSAKPADGTRMTLDAAREQLAKQAQVNQTRVQQHEAGVYDLDRVVIEAQMERKETADQVFDRVFNGGSALWRSEGRSAAGLRDDRDNFGLSIHCQHSEVIGCDNQPLRAQTRKFRDGI